MKIEIGKYDLEWVIYILQDYIRKIEYDLDGGAYNHEDSELTEDEVNNILDSKTALLTSLRLQLDNHKS